MNEMPHGGGIVIALVLSVPLWALILTVAWLIKGCVT